MEMPHHVQSTIVLGVVYAHSDQRQTTKSRARLNKLQQCLC
jgi:hypothetical protein